MIEHLSRIDEAEALTGGIVHVGLREMILQAGQHGVDVIALTREVERAQVLEVGRYLADTEPLLAEAHFPDIGKERLEAVGTAVGAKTVYPEIGATGSIVGSGLEIRKSGIFVGTHQSGYARTDGRIVDLQRRVAESRQLR